MTITPNTIASSTWTEADPKAGIWKAFDSFVDKRPPPFSGLGWAEFLPGFDSAGDRNRPVGLAESLDESPWTTSVGGGIDKYEIGAISPLNVFLHSPNGSTPRTAPVSLLRVDADFKGMVGNNTFQPGWFGRQPNTWDPIPPVHPTGTDALSNTGATYSFDTIKDPNPPNPSALQVDMWKRDLGTGPLAEMPDRLGAVYDEAHKSVSVSYTHLTLPTKA